MSPAALAPERVAPPEPSPAAGRRRSRLVLLGALAAAALGGGLMSMANPPLDAGPIAFAALTPLLWTARRARARRGALLGFVFGLAYFGILLVWLGAYGLIAWGPLVGLQALFPAAFGALLARLWRDDRPLRSAALAAALWITTDWVRGMWPVGGLTWGTLGNTQHANPLLLPLASVTGAWGVTFVVVLVNGVIVAAVARWRGEGRPRRGRRAIARGVAPAVATALAAALLPVLIPLHLGDGPLLRVASVQGNPYQSHPEDRDRRNRTIARNYVELTRQISSPRPDLVVWSENALDVDPTHHPGIRREVAASIRSVGAPAVAGGVVREGDRYLNEMLFYAPDGTEVGHYAKMHLVPFAEYIPWKGVLGWVQRMRTVRRELTPGNRIRLFTVKGVPVGTPVCYENTFPGIVRGFTGAGARLLVVTTNDSSFGTSPASREHVIMSEMRAVENGRWIVQSAISGISAIVDPTGRVRAETPMFREAILRYPVPTATGRTIYTRFGDYLPWAATLTVALALLLAALRRVGMARPGIAGAGPTGRAHSGG